MKPILSSQELNEKFLQAKNDCDEAILSINKIKEEISKKLMIINYVQEFANMKLDTVNRIAYDNTKVSFDNNIYGIYDQFGYTICPKIKSSIDIFNLKLLSSENSINKIMFKQSVTCKVNDIENENYINLLMEDNVIDKQIVFDELKSDTIKIEYQIDNNLSIGASRFNMIEIDPYISGAFDIISIECYDLDASNNLSEIPIKTISSINNIGKIRIILDEKIKFSKVVLTFKNNFNTTINGINIFPFGLKHILFKEVDFLTDSFAVVEIRSNNFIDYIYNDIILYSVNGKIETTMDLYNIEIYTEYNKILSGRVYPSTNASVHKISKNTKVLYLKIPLINKNIVNETKEYLSLTGLKVNMTTQEEIII